jgi:hypothetical protein
MKRPDYIKMIFPRAKGTSFAAVERYFSRLVGKGLKLRYATERLRKDFEYQVKSAERYDWTVYLSGEKIRTLEVELELKEQSEAS